MRILFLFALNQGFTAAKAAHDICAMYREGAVAESTARDYNFKNGYFDLKMHLVLVVQFCSMKSN